MGKGILLAIIFSVFAASAWAEGVVVPVSRVTPEGNADTLGEVVFNENRDGLEIVVKLDGLTPGEHGMHIHEHPSCEPARDEEGEMRAALAAGGHYDPYQTGVHAEPGKNGHQGDLPFITADSEGSVRQNFEMQGLKIDDIINHSLLIHTGGDNYSNIPPNGGGGEAAACGVIRP